MTQTASPESDTAVGFRLSPHQAHVWRLGGTAFSSRCIFELEGGIDPQALRGILNRIVERFEILRTHFHFPPNGGQPIQVVTAAGGLDFREAAHDSLESGPRHELYAQLWEQAFEAFDLEHGPVWRAVWLRDNSERSTLFCALPGMLADRATLRRIAKEITAEHAALDGHGRIAEEALQYADFAQWQNEFLEAETDEVGRAYWRDFNLAGVTEASLPLERQAGQPTAAAPRRILPIEVPAAEIRELARAARSQGASPEDALLAAWLVLLWRLGGTDVLTLGHVRSGRKYPELAGTLGPCDRAVPVECHLSRDISFNDLMKEISTIVADGREFEEYFDWSTKIAAGQIEPAKAFFPYQFERYEGPEHFHEEGLAIVVSALDAWNDRFRLKLVSGPERMLTLHYDTAVFDAPGAGEIAGCLRAVIAHVAADQEARLGEIALLESAARERLLYAWNATERAYPQDRCLHQLFEEHAERCPERTAIVFAEETLSYRELDLRADRLARLLMAAGAGPEQVTAVCVERGPEMAVAVLGVLKSGGAYLPLDSHLPLPRIDYMLEKSGAAILLTREKWLDRFTSFEGRALCLDPCHESPRSSAPGAFHSTARPENLAYLIYTSGSTGRPKGVLSTHRGAVSYLSFLADTYGLGEDARILQLATLSFDASVRDLLGPLSAGATVVLVEALTLLDTAALLKVVEQRRITGLLSVVPSLLRALVQAATPSSGAYRSVNTILTSGERLFHSDCRRAWESFGPQVGIVNQYGPTECTMTASFERLVSGSTDVGSAPIGRPIANTRFYAVDGELDPVPVGVSGLLLIGGAGLARGYVGDPRQSAGSFLPDPFALPPDIQPQRAASTAGGRLYSTGDLVRLLSDGRFEFLGRADQQVKLRGYRVEPSEIDAVLLRHPAVRAAATVAREDDVNGLRLVAYVLPARRRRSLRRDLHAWLREQLPDYMVPAAVVTLASFPLTASGKVDRRALPAPEDAGTSDHEYAAPRTATEEMLVDIWDSVLKVDHVGVLDDFFELGGHSLLANQVVARIRKLFQVELPFRKVFENRILAELAAAIDHEVQSGAQDLEIPAIEPVARQGDMLLSYAQLRLWFLSQMEPESAAYNIFIPQMLRGRLDLDVLDRSLSEVVRRHEALRTSFQSSAGTPALRFHAAESVGIPRIDLSRLAPAAQRAVTERLAAAEHFKPFDLRRAPLYRARLLILSADQHVVFLTMHHIITDAWSMGIFFQELGTLYQAFSRGVRSPLPELEIQYADFAQWQRLWLDGHVGERELAYWRRQLAGLPASLFLATDRSRPPVKTFAGASHRQAFTNEVVEGLRKLSRDQGVTFFMTLLAGFQVLLGRYSGQDDLAVGTPVAGRSHLQTEGLIGFFVNTLVMRSRLAAEISFAELLVRVRETALGAYAHQQLPFEKLVEELNPERNPSHTPLFQVLLVLQNTPSEELNVPELSLEPIPVTRAAAKFDLTLSLTERDSGARAMTGVLVYNRDLFDATTTRRLADHLETLLAEIVKQPEQRLCEFSLLRPAERFQIEAEWNDTARDTLAKANLHGHFERRVPQIPEALALAFRDSALTYLELNRLANGLAHRLRRLGVEPEVLVGICAERSLEMVVALLAVLKAGGAYLPLEPSWPDARLDFVLADARPRVVLAQADVATRLVALAGTPSRVVRLSVNRAPGPVENPEVRTRGEHPAYAIYTSGSTGRPKGAVNTHRAITNRLAWMQETYSLSARDHVLQKTPFGFDVSVWEFFWPLMTGACLVVAEPGSHQDPAYLVAEIRRRRITTLHFVPSMLRIFLEQPEVEDCRTLRRVFASGEALLAELEQRLLSRLDVGLHNLYGPTEAAVDVTFWPCRKGDGHATVPIGRPVSNTEIHLFDSRLRVLALGVSGELHIAGIALARGYLRRPGLTAESFIPYPLPWKTGERMYRTGDLARYLADGSIEFLGRRDYQVKIRGLRIELGEIEASLARLTEVREAIVLARRDRPGELRLVAYVIPRRDLPPAVGELRAELKGDLPEYMVPATYVFLSTWPRTASGKIDRRSLPEPGSFQRAADMNFVAPRNEFEEIVAGIWQDLLDVETVGAEDDFFELGGHSLLAMQLVSRIRETTKVEVPVRQVFDTPTVSGLARIIRDGNERPMPPIEPVPHREALPLSFAQQRLWLLHQMEPASVAYHIPVALRLRGPFNVPAFSTTFGEIVRRHEALRTTFKVVQGGPVQVIAPPASGKLSVVDLVSLPAETREAQTRRWAREEPQRHFDLVRGPLLRGVLLALGPEEHVILMTMHHIVSDGWSMRIMVRELVALYSAFSAGEPSPLPELAIQYADYAIWQRRWLSGRVLEAELAYWRRKLGASSSAGAAASEVPADRPRPPAQTFRGARRRFEISNKVLDGLRSLARSRSVTLYMTLMAALQVLLKRYSGSDDVVVGTPVAGRNSEQIENLIGFFVNTIVIRTDLSGAPSFVETLDRVREVSLEAFSHQNVPFETLVGELLPERDMSRTPFFQVAFTVQNRFVESLDEVPELALEPLPLENTMTKFDLGVGIEEVPDGLRGMAEYRRDLFDETTVRRFTGYFSVLLSNIVFNPAEPISEMALFTPQERVQVLLEWNDTKKECRQRPMVHELVSEHGLNRPAAVALASDEARLTYGELEARSNRLGHHLRSLGVGPEVLVAMCTGRTLNRAVAILGVVKAGGTYVSIDPTHPPERLAFLLGDARAPVILTEKGFENALPPSSARTLCLDADWEEIEGDPSRSPEAGLTPENLAYLVYTSGSTGRPKGVAIPHAGLMNLVRWHQDLYSVRPEDHGTQVASPAFDASIWEFWPYLSAGATLHIPNEETRLSPTGMIRWWARHGITLAYLMTPLAERVLEEKIPRDENLRVRALIIGGDRLHRGPDPGVGFRLMNHYGPAEYSVTSTVIEVPPGGPGRGIPTIGRALDNTEIYLLDHDMEPVLVGVPGELWIGGVGLARGYLRRPGLTAEKFMPHPFSVEPGARLYRTGDLVRWLPDGDMDFLGRLDHQVKLRGLRIELGEIESVLGDHPAIREAVVLVREDPAGEKRLVAYIRRASEELSQDELAGFLKNHLPEYMLPTAFLFLDRLPLTPNGKVDRNALPAPDWDSETPYAAPRTAVEELVATIWSELFGLERVGIFDDFLSIGGHSVLAARVVASVEETFGVELSLFQVFETPTVAGLAAEIEAVQSTRTVPRPPLVAGMRQDPPPLSFAQERMWFLAQMDPRSAAYNVPISLRLQGRLDVVVLERAIEEIVRRHESLRTTFAAVDGQPVQVIAQAYRRRLPLADLSALDSERREYEASRLAHAWVRGPFDLGVGPLAREILLRLQEGHHWFVLSMHHIVSDAGSMLVLVREMQALYCAFLERRASPLAQLSVQYPDYASWQRQWLRGERLEQEVEYWRDKLKPSPRAATVLELPVDRPRPSVQTFVGHRRSFSLPANLVDGVRELRRRQNTTIFMTLVAAFQVLLSRLSGQSEVSIGTPMSGRNQVETENLIGLFLNTLVLRSRVDENATFVDFSKRVRRDTLDAYAHQDLPFEKLITEIQEERNLGRTPLFQVMFVFQTAANSPEGDPQGLALPGIAIEAVTVSTGTAKFDLTLFINEAGGRMFGAWEYNRSIFDGSTIGRLTSHWSTLLGAITEHPEGRLSELPLLARAERQQIMVEWNDTRLGVDEGVGSVHTLFEQRAKVESEAAAVVFGNRTLSYGQLDRRATRLAGLLCREGIGPDVPVALSMPRSLEMLLAVLATFKAGGVCLALDGNFPRHRLELIVNDAKAALRLVRRGDPEVFACDDLPTLHVDTDPQGDAPDIATRRARPAAENLAYLIYTSGSTGKPKGVAMVHRALTNLVMWHLQVADAQKKWRTLQLAPLSFDVSYEEIFATLGAGGTLVLAGQEMRREASRLMEALRTYEIERLCLPPVLLDQLSQQGNSWPVSLRKFLVAGEQLQINRRIQSVFEDSPGATLHNYYGPSESHVVTASALAGAPQDWPALPSIGRPVANSRVYVLDSDLHPVPVGRVGQLYLGGDCLARGYLERPALTADRFGPDAISGKSGARLYMSGDLARRLANGELLFLGRTDHQVKVRGFRIELGEIESVLKQYPTVLEAAAVSHESGDGDRWLVAYTVETRDGRGESRDSAAELRDFLRNRMPEYMIPTDFVSLTAMPLTSSGKIDRLSLPVPRREPRVDGFVAPRSSAEELVAEIWSQVLGRQVGVTDNFFHLGGHSLLATRVLSRLRDTFGVEIEVRQMFQHPTVEGLAAALPSGARPHGSQPEEAQSAVRDAAPPILPMSRGTASPASFAQERLWFLDRMHPGDITYNLPAAVRLAGRLDVAALTAALDAIVRRHEVLRTTFEVCGDELIQDISPPPPLPTQCQPLPRIDLGRLAAKTRDAVARQLALAEARRPFDLSRGPLVRTTLLRLDECDYVMLLTFHHVISDGWSIGIFVRELATFYHAAVEGLTVRLEPLLVQYADFADWQRRWLAGGELERQMDYWRGQLRDAPEVIDLPLDRARPAVLGQEGRNLPLRLQAAPVAALRRLARNSSATLYMALTAGFLALLHRVSGQRDVLAGSPIAGRNRSEIEPLIGFFVNTLVIRSQLDDGTVFRRFLDAVRDTTLAAYAHQDLPFEKLVAELSPKRSRSRSPIFQVMIVHQNVTPMAPGEDQEGKTQAFALPGLSIETLELEATTTKFDLTLGLVETPEGVSGQLGYRKEIFDAVTVERLRGHFGNLLEGATADPDRPLGQLHLIGAAERQQVIVEWNATHRAFAPILLHEQIEVQADLRPQAVAVVFEDEELTYEELEKSANRLAHHLIDLGVGPDDRVGVLMDRSIDLVVSLLAILKTGGAYVPLDPSNPENRLAFMVRDFSRELSAPVLLTRTRTVASLAQLMATAQIQNVHVVDLDAERRAIDSRRSSRPRLVLDPQLAAYAIYTSGSTGRPKGTINSHRGISNRLLWMGEAFRLDDEDRVLQKTPYSFDVSVWEFFWPLTSGARLVVAAPGGHQDPAYLARLIARHEITTLHFVPSMLQAFLERGNLEVLSSLKCVICSGEALSYDLVNRFYIHFGAAGAGLHNLYGPTEAAVEVSWWPCPCNPVKSVPIGRPIANTQTYVMDRDDNPAPIGVPGELHLGGVQLARGYLGRPALTAQRFVPDHLVGQAGRRLYRTGDFSRWLVGGEIDYLGRIDFQVKVRGFRIELGEIEAALESHPGVAKSVVVVRDSEEVEPGLVAYVVQIHRNSGDNCPTAGELRRHLEDQLPSYMVPSTFAFLDSMPLLPSGKVDRSALRDCVEGSRPTSTLVPRDLLELEMARIFEQVLGVKSVGVTESFFDLGGHSLLAVRLMTRIAERWGTEFPVTTIFERATVESLAELLRHRGEEAFKTQGPVLVELQSGGGRRPFFCIHPVGGHVFCYLELARLLSLDRPFYGLQAPDPNELARMRLEDLAAHYVDAVRGVQSEGPWLLGGWSMGAVVAYEMARQLHRDGQEVALVAMMDAPPPRRKGPCLPEELDPASLLSGFARDLVGHDLLSPGELHELGPGDGLAKILDVAQSLGALPPHIDLAHLEHFFELFRHNLRAVRYYEPQPYGGRVEWFRAEATSTAAPENGWQELAAGGAGVHTLPGDHYSMMKMPHVQLLAEKLRPFVELGRKASLEEPVDA